MVNVKHIQRSIDGVVRIINTGNILKWKINADFRCFKVYFFNYRYTE